MNLNSSQTNYLKIADSQNCIYPLCIQVKEKHTRTEASTIDTLYFKPVGDENEGHLLIIPSIGNLFFNMTKLKCPKLLCTGCLGISISP
jgi:hypothetical protein